jgi:hypothetical protein
MILAVYNMYDFDQEPYMCTIRVCMCVCMHVCVCIYIYILSEKYKIRQMYQVHLCHLTLPSTYEATEVTKLI